MSTVAAVSRDGGLTWTDAQTIPGQVGLSDKPAITADPSRPGVTYLVWSGGDGIGFSKTTDGGKTWSQANSFGYGGTEGNQILATPQHTLYDLFSADRTPHKRVCHKVRGHKRCRSVVRHTRHTTSVIKITRSTDGGKTWPVPWTVAKTELAVVTKQNANRSGQTLPSYAISPSGRLYVAWLDDRFSHGRQNAIAISSSPDGRHWSRPARVPSTGPNPAEPALAVTGSGHLALLYYTMPADMTRSSLARAWLRFSTKDTHFGPPIALGRSFDLKDAPFVGGGVVPGPFLGDYQGLAAGKDAVYPFFAVTQAGNSEPHTVIESAQVPAP